MTRIVYTWPTVVHYCAGGSLRVARFRGACVEGAKTRCEWCETQYEYAKAKPPLLPRHSAKAFDYF